MNSSHFEISEETQLEEILKFLLPQAEAEEKIRSPEASMQSRVFKKQQELKTFGVGDGCPSSAALKADFEQKQGRKLRGQGRAGASDHSEPRVGSGSAPMVQIPSISA